MVGQKFVCFTLILLIIGSCTYGLPPPPSSTTIGPLIAGNPRGKRAADAVATPEERNEAIARATATATAVGGASHGPME
uniref:SFRICE_008923 n=1 Tax=Spodoptera frugiperda TaxID=7108 RepID=A0A2H1VT95_SPOFR